MTLASVQRILEVSPIENADRIERVKVLGWDCVVRKGTFKEGDLCVYIEIDTIIPKNLLDETYEGDEVVRLRTVKMKGQISQGLVLPLDVLLASDDTYFIGGEIHIIKNDWYTGKVYREGDDVTERLEIKKYEKKLSPALQGIALGDFPVFIPKTDEVRIQSEPKLLDALYGKPFYITQKLDGTSATYYKQGEHFGVCSRNLELKDGDGLYWKIAHRYHIDEWLKDGYALQCEICGPGIQKNRLELEEHDAFLFSVYDIKKGKYIYPFNWEVYVNPDVVIHFPPQVPELYLDVNSFFDYSLEQLLEMAKGKYIGTNNNQEGIVVRSLDQTISFKVVNNEYLLKDEE